jgi:hypothetical protein
MSSGVGAVAPDNPYAVRADLLPTHVRRNELATGLLAAAYAILLGPVAGLAWAALAPKVSIAALRAGSSETFQAQIGADAWFLLVGSLAGVLVALVAVAFAGEPGPGLSIGIATGGLIAAFVADRIGYLSERTTTQHALLGAHPGGAVISEIDFRIRALGVLTVWPLASLAVIGLVIAVNASRR